jgi:hypothetical protein
VNFGLAEEKRLENSMVGVWDAVVGSRDLRGGSLWLLVGKLWYATSCSSSRLRPANIVTFVVGICDLVTAVRLLLPSHLPLTRQ